MINMPLRATGDAFHDSWRLKGPFLLSHLFFGLLRLAVLAPLTALALRLALALSGRPALSDTDIALFLLSPAGAVAGLLVASLWLATLVLDVSFMMAIALDARRHRRRSFEDGVRRILPLLPRMLDFAWRLLLRLVLIAAPFLMLGLLAARSLLTDYDINYYLSQHPPEFRRAVLIISAVLAAMAVLLVWKLLGWARALPLVLFEGTAPRQAFAESAAAMHGHRLDLLLALIAWAAASTVALGLALGGVGLLAALVTGLIGAHLGPLAAALLLSTGLWVLLNLLITTLTTGALACLLMERAGWPGTAGPDRPGLSRGALRAGLALGLAAALLLVLAGGLDLGRHRTGDSAEIIAHRGAAGIRPENTLASFAKAIEDGADWVELDVQESADGEVIVVHDSDFMKLAGVPTKVWDATAEDLAQIDIGSWFGTDYAGERTPTLTQALDLAKGTASGVLIELKYYGHNQRLEDRVAETVDAAGMAGQVRAMSLDYAGVEKMKTVRPDWQVGLLLSAALGKPWELDADFLAVNAGTIGPGLVRGARDAGKPVYVWTVDDPLQMSEMLSLGVSGLITNEPALARQVVDERARLSSAQRLVLALASRLGLRVSDREYRDGSP